jgi:hypothetical protein
MILVYLIEKIFYKKELNKILMEIIIMMNKIGFKNILTILLMI